MRTNGTCIFLSIVCFLFATTVSANLDPGELGPLAVSDDEYDLGEEVFTPSEFDDPVEITGSVHYPSDLDAGPFPLVVFIHGAHATCFDGNNVNQKWPCEPPKEPIPSHRGFDYVAEILASHGYIVVSISANGNNAHEQGNSPLARAELIDEHLELWKEFNTVGGAPFGNLFVGTIDMDNIGLMGHSRGGEGVVRHFALNKENGSPFGIEALFLLAPTNSNRFTINEVPVAVLLPYCDGDLSALLGIHYYDESRYNVPDDPAPKHTIEVFAANHVFYNTFWTPSIFPPGSQDDWDKQINKPDSHCGTQQGSERLTEAEQRGTGIAYITAFFRAYLGGESQFLSILKAGEPPPSAMSDRIHTSYHPADDPLVRFDVNRFTDDVNIDTNTLGGQAFQFGLTDYELCGGPLPQPQTCMANNNNEFEREPHISDTFSFPGLTQLRIGWDALGAIYQNDLPEGSRNVSGYQALQFRAGVDFTDERNLPDMQQDFSVTLIDGAGLRSTPVRVSQLSKALFFPPGDFDVDDQFPPPVPHLILNTVRLPVSAFTGIFRSDIRSIEFKFDQEPEGAILITDLAFVDEVFDKTPSVSCSVDVPVLPSSGFDLINVGLTVKAKDDIDEPFVQVSVYSDEDDEQTDGSPDAKDIAPDTLRLRADRDPAENGRVYEILVQASDAQGNIGFTCCSVVVPHHGSQSALDEVSAEAALLEEQCTVLTAVENGLLPLPNLLFVVGDGPIIGPKQ